MCEEETQAGSSQLAPGRLDMTKQKIVIKVAMTCDKSRSKAMALVAATCGVDSVALAGDAKDQVVVVGDDVDSVKLTHVLRKKVGPACLVEVGEVKKEEKKKPEVQAPVVEYTYPFHHYYNSCPPPVYHHYPAAAYSYHDRPGTCSIM